MRVVKLQETIQVLTFQLANIFITLFAVNYRWRQAGKYKPGRLVSELAGQIEFEFSSLLGSQAGRRAALILRRRRRKTFLKTTLS